MEALKDILVIRMTWRAFSRLREKHPNLLYDIDNGQFLFTRWGQANLIDLFSHRPFCKLSQKVSTTPPSSGLLANSSASFLKPLLLTPLVLAVTPSPTLDSSNRLTLCPIRPIPGSPSQPLSHGSGATPQPAADRTVYRQSSLSRLSLSLSLKEPN